LQAAAPFVVTLNIVMAGFAQQLSVAVGGVIGVPHWMVTLAAQAITGATVSMTLTKLVQNEELPQQSVACHATMITL
jgi:hypothetical protein